MHRWIIGLIYPLTEDSRHQGLRGRGSWAQSKSDRLAQIASLHPKCIKVAAIVGAGGATVVPTKSKERNWAAVERIQGLKVGSQAYSGVDQPRGAVAAYVDHSGIRASNGIRPEELHASHGVIREQHGAKLGLSFANVDGVGGDSRRAETLSQARLAGIRAYEVLSRRRTDEPRSGAGRTTKHGRLHRSCARLTGRWTMLVSSASSEDHEA